MPSQRTELDAPKRSGSPLAGSSTGSSTGPSTGASTGPSTGSSNGRERRPTTYDPDSGTGAGPGGGEAGERTWTIAQVADEFGITHRTVRHYEDLGLIAPERRGTQRIYHRRDKIRLALILRGKRLGFPLEEIRKIVDMYDGVPGEAGQLRYVLQQIHDRRADLEQRRRDLDDLFQELAEFERRCREDLAGME